MINGTNTTTSTVGMTVDGNGSAITTGSKGYIQLNANYVVTGWTLTADQSGSIVVDVHKCAKGAFPTTATICAAAPPTLTAQQRADSTAVGTWTTVLNTDDVLEFIVDSCATIQRCTLTLVTRKLS